MGMKKGWMQLYLRLFFAFVLIPVVGIVAFPTNEDQKPRTTYWTADSAVAQSLRDYVAKVTDPKDEGEFYSREGQDRGI